MKKIFVVCVLMFTLLLSSCGLGSLTSDSKDAANCFFEYISNGNYTDAEAMMDGDVSAEEIEDLFDNVKQKYRADIANGYSITFTGFNSTNSLFGDSNCELSGTIKIDGVDFELYLVFVEKADALKLNTFHLNHIENTVIGDAI